MNEFTHIDEKGRACMVDVSEKPQSARGACASGSIKVSQKVLDALREDKAPKGDVFAAARIAGIMAAKRTSDLIPLCHPLSLSNVTIDFKTLSDKKKILCECSVKLVGNTGAEMEALTGTSVALLTIYDMCKALDKEMEIGEIRLEEKFGGKSGLYKRSGK